MAAELAKQGIALAALTDHNTALNCPAFKAACGDAGVLPLFGLEAQTQEEVHVLCLFSALEVALAFGEELGAILPRVQNKPEIMGDQVYVDAEDTILGEVAHFLVVSAPLDAFALADRVHTLGGLVIPAHVDRPSFSFMSQFGTIPPGPWDALEHVGKAEELSLPGPYPLIQSSDAHYLTHIARRFTALDTDVGRLRCKDGTVDMEELRKALGALGA
jgi:PHP family Zn ribbon phosphoesterase